MGAGGRDARIHGAAIEAGELKFVLTGQKVRGRFTIVRTSRRPGAAPTTAFEDDSEQWLLIKKRDADAVAGWDAEDHPQSVKTGRTNDEVKANRDALWVSEQPAAVAEIDLSGAVERAMPRAHRTDARDARRRRRSPTPTGCSRSSGTATGSRRSSATARSSSGPATSRMPRRTSRACCRRRPGSTPARRSSTARSLRSTTTAARTSRCSRSGSASAGRGAAVARGAARAAAGPLVYQVFDLLHLDGRSLLGVPLEDRKRLLRSVLRETNRVRFAAHVVGEGEAFMAAARGPAASRASSRSSAARVTSPGKSDAGLAQAEDPAGAGARRRRLDARRGQRPGPRRGGGRRVRGAAGCDSPARSGRASRRPPGSACSPRWRRS